MEKLKPTSSMPPASTQPNPHPRLTSKIYVETAGSAVRRAAMRLLQRRNSAENIHQNKKPTAVKPWAEMSIDLFLQTQLRTAGKSCAYRATRP
jgi:hypothetical protein